MVGFALRDRLRADARQHPLVLGALLVTLAGVPLGEEAVDLLVPRVGDGSLLQLPHSLVGFPLGEKERAQAKPRPSVRRLYPERLAVFVLSLLLLAYRLVAAGQVGVEGGVLRKGGQRLVEVEDGEEVHLLFRHDAGQPRMVARIAGLEPRREFHRGLLGGPLLLVQQPEVPAGGVEIRVYGEGLAVLDDRRVGVAAPLEGKPLQEVAGCPGRAKLRHPLLGVLSLLFARLRREFRDDPLRVGTAVGLERPVEAGGEQGHSQQ